MASHGQDPVRLLVAAIAGPTSPHSPQAGDELVSLANRVLSSQIGREHSSTDDLSSTWRRISRKAPNAKTAKDDVERIYQAYEQEAAMRGHPDVPPKMLGVLTKLMGKRIPTYAPRPAPKNTATTRASPSPPRKISPAKQRLMAYNQQHASRVAGPSTSSTAGASYTSASLLSANSSRRKQPPPSSSSLQPTPVQQIRHPTPPRHPPAPAPQRTSPSPRARRAALGYGSPLKQRAEGHASTRFPQHDRAAPTHSSPPRKSSSQPSMADTEQHLHRQKQQLEQEEQALLRECLYSLQGIDGERIQYYHRHDEDNPHPPLPTFATYEGIRIKSFALDQRLLYEGRVLETKLGTGAEDALRICGEAGWFYTRIQSYIHEVQQGDQAKGVVARAFAEGLAEQLREFHSLLTDYEQRLQDMSLRQLMIELQAPTNRLKILAMLADGLRMYRGGHLLTALYKHSIHGNTVHCSIVATLLQKASRPWFEILYMWTTQGVLSDPWNEFFVVEKEDVDDKFLWQEKYSINLDLVPTGILGRDLVVPAFKVGKGINFIRRCLMDGRWTMHLSASGEDGDDTRMSDDTSDGNNNRELGYRYAPHKIGDFENEALKKTLTIAGSLVNSHILQTLKEENHLMQHLFALKQFLLLGQGDFFSALMEGLHNEYSNTGERSSVTGIYKHSLLAIVEGALRSTNAKYLPQYAIDRLQVELLLNPGEETGDVWGPKDIPEGSNDGRTVYDVFMLDYQVPDPIMAVVHPTALERYKSVFSLLFRLKKIEFMLNFTWRQSATLSHALQTSAQYTGIDIHESEGYAQATFLLRNISILRQSMTHMVVNLKSYLMFEVIEGGWQRLSGTMEEVSTLDETIAAHDVYLNGIVRKSMVRDRGRDDPMQNHLADQVDMVLAITDEFCTLQEIIFRQSLRAADVAAEKRVEAESRLDRGQWGFDSEQENTEQETFFGLAEPTLLEEIRRISAAYNEHALGFLDALSDKVNGLSSDFENDANLNNLDQDPYGNSATRIRTFRDDDLDPQRFLIAQLDHNQYYADQAMGQ